MLIFLIFLVQACFGLAKELDSIVSSAFVQKDIAQVVRADLETLNRSQSEPLMPSVIIKRMQELYVKNSLMVNGFLDDYAKACKKLLESEEEFCASVKNAADVWVLLNYRPSLIRKQSSELVYICGEEDLEPIEVVLPSQIIVFPFLNESDYKSRIQKDLELLKRGGAPLKVCFERYYNPLLETLYVTPDIVACALTDLVRVVIECQDPCRVEMATLVKKLWQETADLLMDYKKLSHSRHESLMLADIDDITRKKIESRKTNIKCLINNGMRKLSGTGFYILNWLSEVEILQYLGAVDWNRVQSAHEGIEVFFISFEQYIKGGGETVCIEALAIGRAGLDVVCAKEATDTSLICKMTNECIRKTADLGHACSTTFYIPGYSDVRARMDDITHEVGRAVAGPQHSSFLQKRSIFNGMCWDKFDSELKKLALEISSKQGSILSDWQLHLMKKEAKDFLGELKEQLKIFCDSGKIESKGHAAALVLLMYDPKQFVEKFDDVIRFSVKKDLLVLNSPLWGGQRYYYYGPQRKQWAADDLKGFDQMPTLRLKFDFTSFKPCSDFETWLNQSLAGCADLIRLMSVLQLGKELNDYVLLFNGFWLVFQSFISSKKKTFCEKVALNLKCQSVVKQCKEKIQSEAVKNFAVKLYSYIGQGSLKVDANKTVPSINILDSVCKIHEVAAGRRVFGVVFDAISNIERDFASLRKAASKRPYSRLECDYNPEGATFTPVCLSDLAVALDQRFCVFDLKVIQAKVDLLSQGLETFDNMPKNATTYTLLRRALKAADTKGVWASSLTV